MLPKQAVALGVRLFVIYLVVVHLESLPRFIITLNSASSDPHLVSELTTGLIATAIALAVICWGLWPFPLTIARAILPASEAVTEKPQSPDEWFQVGCNLLALYFLGGALSALIPNLFLTGLNYSGQPVMGYILKDAIQIIVAIFLLFGKQGILKLIRYTHAPEE